MLDIKDVRQLLVRPVLQYCGLHSRSAENLLIGTGLVESQFQYLIQKNGIALGLFQIEPNTFSWLIAKLSTDKKLMLRVLQLLGMATLPVNHNQLINNFALSCIIARLKYWYDPTPLPDADNIEGLARYWSRIYNSKNDEKSIQRFIDLYDRYGQHNSD